MEKRKIHKRFFAVSAVMLILCSIILTCMGTGVTAFADGKEDTGVMTDLMKDGTFNANDYPASRSDYSLQVIQIAETNQGCLAVYVYQPSAPFRELPATHLSIATDKDNLQPHMYSVKLVSSYGVFFKYLVENLPLKQDKLRVYEIISIFRKWDKEIDLPAEDGSGNTINEVSYEVGQLWSANTIEGGEVLYHCEAKETITVTGKLCGFLRYGYLAEFTDAWFVAFNTDKPIGELLEADVYYVSEDYISGMSMERWEEVHGEIGDFDIVGPSTVYDEAKETIKQVDFKQKGTNIVENPNLPDEWKDKHHFWAQHKVHVFDRIQTVEEFKDGEKLTGGTKEGLEGLSWVLRFVETPYANVGVGDQIYKDVDMYGYHWESVSAMGTKVSSVSIMRLKFRTAGKTYNLGVVDNMQTSADKPSGGKYYGNSGGLPWWVWVLIGLVVISPILLFLSIIFPPLGAFLKLVIKSIGFLFTGLWWIICLPFRGIAALIRKHRERKDE